MPIFIISTLEEFKILFKKHSLIEKGSKPNLFPMIGVVGMGKKKFWTFLVYTLHKQIGFGEFFHICILSNSKSKRFNCMR